MALVAPSQIKELVDRKMLVSLSSFNAFLGCGFRGFGSLQIVGPFYTVTDKPFAIPFSLQDDLVETLPNSHKFLGDGGLALTVINPSVLSRVDNIDFFFLSTVNLSLKHFMPIIEDLQGSISVDLSNGAVDTEDKRFRDKGYSRFGPTILRNMKQNPDNNTISIDLVVSNILTSQLKRFRAVMFGAPSDAFPNKDHEITLENPINSIGPFATYVYGDIMPGNAVSRTVIYDLSNGPRFRIGWSLPLTPPALVGLVESGGCFNEIPEPIPDPDINDTPDSTCWNTVCSDTCGPSSWDCFRDSEGDCACWALPGPGVF
jgi:hypothetical protein